MTPPADDGTVVVALAKYSISRRLTVDAYLAGEETSRPQELAFGILREPPGPGFHHQTVVGRLHERLAEHVRRYRLGTVVESPVDVIRDRERALVVQPDLVFVSHARTGICTDRIWGAPDLTIEVLSDSRRRHDRVVKVEWYRRYGVIECWVVDPVSRDIEVIDVTAPPGTSRTFRDAAAVRSAVLPPPADARDARVSGLKQRRVRLNQRRSTASATPFPPPRQSVAMPRLSRRCSSA